MILFHSGRQTTENAFYFSISSLQFTKQWAVLTDLGVYEPNANKQVHKHPGQWALLRARINSMFNTDVPVSLFISLLLHLYVHELYIRLWLCFSREGPIYYIPRHCEPCLLADWKMASGLTLVWHWWMWRPQKVFKTNPLQDARFRWRMETRQNAKQNIFIEF